MFYNTSPSQLIRQRYSCRTYQKRPLEKTDLSALENYAGNLKVGPLGNPLRYRFTAALDRDARDLKGLGTYGFIKDPAAFIIGALRDRPGALEDFGYLMELLILKAADLDIGSCWLGGTFTKSSFSKRMELEPDETIPAVISIGYPANRQAFLDRMTRIYAGADHRRAWRDLFFEDFWDIPLTEEKSGEYSEALRLVRLAPSASNKQPWRVITTSQLWHFYLRRTPHYPSPTWDYLLGLADLQRIDMGIAMAHFELGLRESGISGRWSVSDPGLAEPKQNLTYTVTWIPDQLK